MIREIRLILATWALGWVSTYLPGDHPALAHVEAAALAIQNET